MNFLNIVELKTFNVFVEYFVGVSIFYVFIIVVLIIYNVYGLVIQKTLSDCIALILFLCCFLILNDNLFFDGACFDFYSILGFYKSVITDCLASFTKFVICFFSALYFFIIGSFLKNYKLIAFEYLLFLLFSVLALLLLCSSNDLLIGFLSIELVSLSSYILSAFKKMSSYSAKAGIKYLIIGAIASSFFLLGCSFLYACSGTVNIINFWLIVFDDNWFNVSNTNSLLKLFLEIGLALIVFSLAIKLALAPFHLWSIDVYEGSPTITTFFFAIITKLSFFVFLIWIFYIAAFKYNETCQFYSVVIAFCSVFVGSFGGLRQRNLKTLLAYSSVSHLGYILLAFSAGSQFGAEMLLLYLFIYMLSGILVWFVILIVWINRKRYTDKFNKELGDLALLKKSNSAIALALALTIFSIAGIPPLVGFFAKINIFLALLHVKYYFVALFSIVCSVVSSFYYIWIIKVLYFENFLVGQLYFPLVRVRINLFSILLFLLLFIFVKPTFLYLIVCKLF